jgi:hypothetical protein
MPNSHIALRIENETLVNEPHVVLARMNFKILEKREQLLNSKIDTSVQFHTNSCIEQGILQSIHANYCQVKVGGEKVKVPFKKLINL